MVVETSLLTEKCCHQLTGKDGIYITSDERIVSIFQKLHNKFHIYIQSGILPDENTNNDTPITLYMIVRSKKEKVPLSSTPQRKKMRRISAALPPSEQEKRQLEDDLRKVKLVQKYRKQQERVDELIEKWKQVCVDATYQLSELWIHHQTKSSYGEESVVTTQMSKTQIIRQILNSYQVSSELLSYDSENDEFQ